MSSPEKTFLPHYTPQDIESVMYVLAWIEQNNYTQAALARLARISSATLNQILKGVYPTAMQKHLSTIMSAIRNVDETKTQAEIVVETGIFKLAQSACMQARTQKNFSVLSANVGTGKTFAIKHYTKSNANTYLIEAKPTMTLNSLVKLLAETVLGYKPNGSLDDKFQEIIDSLKNTDSLIIIDEAETLTPKQLHAIRRLSDIAGIGVVLAGTEYLRVMIKPERGQFDQIRSRTGFFPVTISAISHDDAAALIQANIGSNDITEDVIERLYKYSKGSARMLVNALMPALRKFQGERVLDVELIDAVATQVLGLEAIGGV